jgi:hypothetical protein
MQAITMDWRQFKDETSFQRFVDRQLSADQYKHLIQTDGAFRNRINGNPWDSTPNARDARPATINPASELAKMIKADEDEATRPERELAEMVNQDIAAKKLRLQKRLDSGQGLDAQLCAWVGLPNNIPIMPIPVAGFTGAGLGAIKTAAKAFMAKHGKEGRFNQDEQLMLMKTMTDACEIVGKMFDPRVVTSWEAVYMTCLMSDRIRPQRTAEPKPETPDVMVNVTKKAEPTAEEKRKQYMNCPVFKSHKLGRTLTAYDVDQLLGEDYKTIIREGYKADGPLLLNTDQLRPGRVN